MSIESSYNFRKLSGKLTTSGVVSEDTLKSLSEEGYEAVVNLLPQSNEHAVPEEKEIIESQGIFYVHIPVDFAAPTKVDLEEFISQLDNMSNKKMHIHCAANWRVSAFYSVYAVSKGIWSSDAAKEFIAGLWNPSEYPVWQKLLKQYGLAENDS